MVPKRLALFMLALWLSPVFSVEIQPEDNPAFRMREHDTNYLISGKPDTKVQFSFKFKMLEHYDLFFAFTQTMFWELGRANSNPFSEINFNPELFYAFPLDQEAWVDEFYVGYSHFSNGKDDFASRSIDSAFVQFTKSNDFGFGLTRYSLELRYIMLTDPTNRDIRDFYGPYVLTLFFNNLGEMLFRSEQFYLEYYNGGQWGEDFSKSSIRLSLKFRIWDDGAPELFAQYFNGYGENLANYSLREETYRIGLSLGGY